MILLAAFGRVRIRVPRQFRVALTSIASLQDIQEKSLMSTFLGRTLFPRERH